MLVYHLYVAGADDYDNLFDEVRKALTTDIAYSILLAKAANTILARREVLAAKRVAADQQVAV